MKCVRYSSHLMLLHFTFVRQRISSSEKTGALCMLDVLVRQQSSIYINACIFATYISCRHFHSLQCAYQGTLGTVDS